MKTSRVRVHRNSVYYRNSRIASWRANEQSIVPPFPDENSRWSKNFAKQGQPEGGDVARKHRYRTKKQVFDSGQEGKNKGKRDDGEWTFHFSLPSDPKFHISVEQKRLIRWEGRNGIWWCFKRGSLEGSWNDEEREEGLSRMSGGAKWCRSMDGGGLWPRGYSMGCQLCWISRHLSKWASWSNSTDIL